MIGKKFGRLMVLEELPKRTKYGRIVYKCLCECGNICNVIGSRLRNGNTRSCGCSKGRQIKHGKTHTRMYGVYKRMKNRCYNKNNPKYSDYGARGIVVCDEWLDDFMNFYNWAINNGYRDDLTIDRMDNDGDYEPNNCRWATPKQQANNTRRNIFLTYNGKTQTMQQWAEELNINYSTIRERHRLGYTDKECLFGRDK